MTTEGTCSAAVGRSGARSYFGPDPAAVGVGTWRAHVVVAALGGAASVATLAYAIHARSAFGKLNDFYREAWPAYLTLSHGHPLGFLRLGPTYVGSLVLRAPFALVPRLWSGGSHAAYIASAVPCMIAVVALCAWLAAQPRRRGGIGWASRLMPIALCILNPLVLVGLIGGHPEEPLGAALCVGAVVLASAGKARWAVLVTLLAVINKPWGLVAAPVVFVTLPQDRRRLFLATAAAAAAVLLPIMALRHNGFSATATGAGIGGIFNPAQLLWWFGPHAWIAREARALIVLMAFLCAAMWWQRASRQPARMQDALLLLALVLLLRAALDPWNNLYYHVPFLFALLAYETRSGRIPLFTMLYTVLLLIVVPIYGVVPMSSDLRAAMYAVIVVPTISWIVARLFVLGVADRVSPGVRFTRPACVAPVEPT